MKIAVFSARPYDKKYLDNTNKYNFEIHYFEESLNENNAKITKNFNAVCAFVNDNLNKNVIKILKENNIKIIAMRCSGINNVDLQAAKENNIHVVNVVKYSLYSVAEHTVGLILSLNRHIHKAYSRVRNFNFSLDGFLGFNLNNKIVGIIGMGMIGKTLSKILLGFGCKILAYDPKIKIKENKISYTDLKTLYNESDIISLHCPLFSDTYHLINENSISQMKKNVMLINTSRGALIDKNSLIPALKSGQIGYLGLDVYEEEENLFFKNLSEDIVEDDIFARLLTFPNVLITAHQAFFTKEALTTISETILKNIHDIETGNFSNDLTKQS